MTVALFPILWPVVKAAEEAIEANKEKSSNLASKAKKISINMARRSLVGLTGVGGALAINALWGSLPKTNKNKGPWQSLVDGFQKGLEWFLFPFSQVAEAFTTGILLKDPLSKKISSEEMKKLVAPVVVSTVEMLAGPLPAWGVKQVLKSSQSDSDPLSRIEALGKEAAAVAISYSLGLSLGKKIAKKVGAGRIVTQKFYRIQPKNIVHLKKAAPK